MSQQQPQPKPQPKQYGVTPPISVKPPTQKEIEHTQALVDLLRAKGQYESEEESRKREVVLGQVNVIFKEFVRRVAIRKGIDEIVAQEVGGKIFTFGSFRLGVHGRGSDLDTLCVAPNFVEREDFFDVDHPDSMFNLLKIQPEVKEITPVPDAFVPVITFEFSGFPIDLTFANLKLSAIPDDLVLDDDNLLVGRDDACVRSLNGSRVTDKILQLVPNIENFRIALRCVKLWAKQRAIYSNIVGFFGGVAWAIVVARICQFYPNAAAGVIVSKFFYMMTKWSWPGPVYLTPITDGPLPVRVWNPKIYNQDRSHRMPVITPAYPCMCATHNVSESTQKVTTKELERATGISNKVLEGLAEWEELFEESSFFSEYRAYLAIIASANAEEPHLKWSGLVESKIRQMVARLDYDEGLEYVHPYIKGFERVYSLATPEERDLGSKGLLPAPARDANDLDDPTKPWKLYTTTFYIGLQVRKDAKRLDFAHMITEFQEEVVKKWNGFDKHTMAIHVTSIRKTDLPLDVRPTTPMKTAKGKKRKSQGADDANGPQKKSRLSGGRDTFITNGPPTPTAVPDLANGSSESDSAELPGLRLPGLSRSSVPPHNPPAPSNPTASVQYGGMSGINQMRKPDIGGINGMSDGLLLR
ncbi:polynucleotide adenylyltransferase [Rhizophlyctis rosea]|uniref:Poly(A) polymerase n=1 Tax=Rhizophlyctis rosea TaxID=64517 RepID=A0AAD5S8G0_9FUNG|nr:polynucleotide adenylyltransferase [Rhizophlyctis rosea]